MRKMALVGALLMAAALALSGCVSIPLTQVQTAGQVTLPEPSVTPPPAPTGDSWAPRTVQVDLYYIDADQQQLSPLSRSIRLEGAVSVAEAALERLLEGTDVTGLVAVAAEDVALTGLEISQGIAMVDLSVDALELDGQGLCWMKAAIANTLVGLEGIQYVQVLVDGKEESAMSLPTGALTANNATLTALWAQQQADEERFAANPATAQIQRRITLYFGAQQDGRLLPEVRQVVLSSGNVAQDIIEALRQGPDSPYAHAVFPQDAALTRSPEIATLEDGRRVLLLSFSEGLYEKLERDGMSAWQLVSALTHTLCRTIPQLDGITVGVNGQLITRLESETDKLVFEDAVIAPRDFDDAVARMAVLYFAGSQGGLTRVERAMDLVSAVSPRALLAQLIAGPDVLDQNALPVFPQGVTEADLLGIRIEDGCALVNLSSNLYRLCQDITQEQERSLIYSMVNTLCALEEVDRVRFYVGGAAVDSLAGWIYLKGELLPNPGLVAQAQEDIG